MIGWSQEDIEKVKSAHAECMELMGKYAEPSVLNIVIQSGAVPSPDEVITIMHNSASKYLDHMMLTQEAKHQITEGLHGLKVSCHYNVKRNWYKYHYDIPEREYQKLNLEVVDWLAEGVFSEARKDVDNGKSNNASKRSAITWDHVIAAVDTVNKEILSNPAKYRGQGYDQTFTMFAEELIKSVDTSKSGLYKWLRDTNRTRKDTYKLLSNETRKVIKNIK